MEQRRKGIEMAGSNIDRSWNHVEQMNDGGNSTHKTMRQRRKRIEMAPLKSGLTGAVSASAREQNNADMAQQRELELSPDTPDDQDELKLKGSKSRDMVDVLKSGWTLLMTSLILEMASAVFDQLGYALVGMVLAFVALLLSTAELIRMARKERMIALVLPVPEPEPEPVFTGIERKLKGFEQDELKKLKGSKSRDKAPLPVRQRRRPSSVDMAQRRRPSIVDMAQQREPLLTGEFERANDLTEAGIELPPDTSDDQEPLFLALDSVHHVDRIVPPTIDENYNRRENSQQQNVAGDEGTTPEGDKELEAATRAGRYFEKFRRWLMSSDDGDKEPGEYEEPGENVLVKEFRRWLMSSDDGDKEPGEDVQGVAFFFTRLKKSAWTLLLTSLIIEIASAVCDQLGHALVGMVLAYVALLVATADLLIHKARKERMMAVLPISQAPRQPVGTIVEYFGFVSAVWQCVFSTVAYTSARQKRENPIKVSLLNLIFLSCVAISKLEEKIQLIISKKREREATERELQPTRMLRRRSFDANQEEDADQRGGSINNNQVTVADQEEISMEGVDNSIEPNMEGHL